jgi:hypothetical protein
VERADRVVRDVLPKVETSRIDEIDNNATARVIRSAKARGEAFFFILFWGEILGTEYADIPSFSTGKLATRFQEKSDHGLLGRTRRSCEVKEEGRLAPGSCHEYAAASWWFLSL